MDTRLLLNFEKVSALSALNLDRNGLLSIKLRSVEICKVLISTAVLFLAMGAVAEQNEQEESNELETYIWLEREAIGDPEISNLQIHKLIAAGLQHDDQEVIHCTVSAIALHIGAGRVQRVRGVTPTLDRRLQDIPDLYENLTGMWEIGWKEAGGVMPDRIFPDDLSDRLTAKTGCIGIYPTWSVLPLSLAYLFPGDEKVYEIIYNAFPEPTGGFSGDFPDGTGDDPNNPGPLLAALFEGKFNRPNDERIRTELFLDRGTIYHTSQLIARSLGEFRSDKGLEALAQVLEEDNMKYGTPKIPIVEAMLKYEEQASQYVPLMKEKLESARPLNSLERGLKDTLKEHLVKFEREYAEKAVDRNE